MHRVSFASTHLSSKKSTPHSMSISLPRSSDPSIETLSLHRLQNTLVLSPAVGIRGEGTAVSSGVQRWVASCTAPQLTRTVLGAGRTLVAVAVMRRDVSNRVRIVNRRADRTTCTPTISRRSSQTSTLSQFGLLFQAQNKPTSNHNIENGQCSIKPVTAMGTRQRGVLLFL